MKTRVAVIFGGKSVEHEVSIISGLQAFAALDRAKYEAVPLYIAKDGKWYTGEHMGDIESYKDMKDCLKRAVRVVPTSGEKGGADLLRWPPKRFGRNVVGSFDVALPVVHAPMWRTARCPVIWRPWGSLTRPAMSPPPPWGWTNTK